MNFETFNARKQLIMGRMNAVSAEPTDANLADLFIAAAIQELILMDCNEKDGWVPTPICAFFVYRDLKGEIKSLYLFPSDQAIPD